jgi:putative hydrolase of the HAD superfamily
VLKAVFFDIDDTLSNRSMALRECVSELTGLIKQTCPLVSFSYDEFFGAYRRYSGLHPTRQETLKRVFDHLGVSDEKLRETLSAVYIQRMDERPRLFDNTIEVLTALKRDYILGVISNAPSESQRAKMARMGLAGLFDHVVISSEIVVAKPDPLIFAHALGLAQVDAREAAYVGDDEEMDVDGACNAGMVVIWANMYARSAGGRSKPHAEIRELIELPAILNNWT